MTNTTPPAPGTVRITCTTPRFQRSRNGAWLGAGAENTVREVPEAEAPRWVTNGGYSHYSLEYADGLFETLDFAHTPVRFWSSAAPIMGPAVKHSRALGRIGYYGIEGNNQKGTASEH